MNCETVVKDLQIQVIPFLDYHLPMSLYLEFGGKFGIVPKLSIIDDWTQIRVGRHPITTQIKDRGSNMGD